MIKIIRARNIMVYIMAAVLILFMGISQVMPSYADTGGVNGDFVITDGVLTSYTGTDKKSGGNGTSTEYGKKRGSRKNGGGFGRSRKIPSPDNKYKQ